MDATRSTSDGNTFALATIPTAPRTPSKRARALIFAYTGSQKVLAIGGLMFFIIGSVITLPFCWGLPVDLAIAVSHRTVTATPVAVDVNESASSGGEHPRVITFNYDVDGKTFTGTCNTFDRDVIEIATRGLTSDAEVSRINPTWSRLAGTTRSTFGYSVSFVLIFPVVGLTMLYFAIRSNRREIRAFRFGTPVMARVVFRGEDASTSVNGRHPLMIKWEFMVNDEIYEGSISSMSVLAIESLGNDEEIPVLYLPDNPRINTIYVP
jgi:hypothetical protein